MLIPFEVETDGVEVHRQQTPVVVWGLIALCIAVHCVLAFRLSEAARLDIWYRFGAARFRFVWWTSLTCTLLHGSWMHLLGNLCFLWVYGKDLERILGSLRFLVLYAAGAVLSIAVHLLTVAPFLADEPTIGASGAVSAVLGAFLVFLPQAKLRCLFFSFISFRPIVVRAPAFVVLGLWFAGQLIYSLKLVGDIGNIAFWAHVSGFAGGAGIATLFRRAQQKELDTLMQALKLPLLEGWQAVFRGDSKAASTWCSQLDEAVIDDMCGNCHFLRGLVGMREAGGAADAAHLLRAFCQARDYRQDHAILSIYMSIMRHLDVQDIPPWVHKDAGFAALSMKKYDLTLRAFHRAIAAGCRDGLQPMLRAVEAIQRRETACAEAAQE